MELIQKLSALALKLLQDSSLYIAALNALIVALIGMFILIPGDQPEKALQKVLDILAKISIKKKV